MEDLKYPVGGFSPDQGSVESRIRDCEELPAKMRAAVDGLDDSQLDTPYRDGGWTVRQVVHHVADSHMNGLTRLKLALTEDSPTIKPYDEVEWAKLADAQLPIEVSLPVLDGIHHRWTTLWKAMTAAEFEKTFTHPDHGRRTLDWLLSMYSWHSRHHVAHITSLRSRMGW